MRAILEVGHLDAIFKRSKGCISPSGWKCDSLPYLVEFDNFGRGPNPNVADPKSMFCWGWDEISWFAQQPEEYRNQWLLYAHNWIKQTDPNGHLEMPGTRMISCPNETLRTYFANTKSPTCPVGYSQEETIKKIWNQGQSSPPVFEGENGSAHAQMVIHVAPNGDDANPGTVDKPVRTPLRVRDLVRTIKAKSVEPITVHFAPGTYYLAETFVLGPEDSGTAKAPITYVASTDGPVILSGGVKLDLRWKLYKHGIMQAEIATPRDEKVAIDQLFVNGRAMPMARYPNYKADARPFNGTAADAISPERVKRWANPVGAYIHALHSNEWGDFHYRVTGVDDKGNAKLEGGWQNNRRYGYAQTAPVRRERL